MTDPIPASAHPGVQLAHLHVSLLTRGQVTTLAGSAWFPDVSEFNGAIDWVALGAAYRAGTISGVAIRAGFGTVRPDSQFRSNQAGARVQGIPTIYYWFTYPAYNAPSAEAAMFNATVGSLRPSEAMCGDFEDDPSARPFPRGQAGLDWCRAFLTALQAPQNATWWYTYPSLLSSVGLQPLIGAWPFWEADYSATPDSAFAPAIARQFTDCGSTPGVGGCCDQSRVLRAPLDQWLTPGLPAASSSKGEGDGMGIAVRPDGTGQLDWLEVTGSDRHVEHRVLTPGQAASAAPVDSIGGANFVPNSVRAWWNATTTALTVMGQVSDGSWWAIGWNGAWGTWLPTGISTALPEAVPAQPDDDSALAARIATLETDLADIKAAIK